MEKNESIGIASGAYSVGRSQILKWINDLAQLNYTKVEQTASGVFVCHVFDALYPGQLRLEKVKFDAKRSYDYIHNYKVLQACFNRVGMQRHVDVEKLIEGKYQDNFEFMQWVKAFFDGHANDDARAYNGLSRRQQLQNGRGITSSTAVGPMSSSDSVPTKGTTRAVRTATATSATTGKWNRPTGGGVGRGGSTAKTNRVGLQKNGNSMMAASNAQVTKLKQEVEGLKADKEDLQAAVEDAVTEREFYFNKLRKVELICQGASDQVEESEDCLEFLRDTLEHIKVTLYAEDDVPVADDEVAGDGEGEDVGEDGVDGQFDDGDDDAVYEDVQIDPEFQSVPPDKNGH